MSVYSKLDRKGNKVWYAYVYGPHGRRIRQKAGPNKTLARKLEAKLKFEIAEGRFLDIRKNERIRFRDFAAQYLETYSRINKRDKGKTDAHLIKVLNGYFGNMFLEEIDQEGIEKFKAQCLRRRRSNHPNSAKTIQPATVNRLLGCLSAILRRAMEWKKLRPENRPKIKWMKEPEGRVRYLSREELQKLLDGGAEGRLRDVIQVALATGMRLGELRDMRRGHINYTDRTIAIPRQKNGEFSYRPIRLTLVPTTY